MMVGAGAFVDLGYAVVRLEPSSSNPPFDSNAMQSDLNGSENPARISPLSGLPSFLETTSTVEMAEFEVGTDRMWSPMNYQPNSGGIRNAGILIPDNELQDASLPNMFIYDTWSLDFERDGIDQDGDTAIDEGMDGIDDDSVNGVDDGLERETQPPYDVKLRGIEVRLRLFEASTGQVRQGSVVGDFVPK